MEIVTGMVKHKGTSLFNVLAIRRQQIPIRVIWILQLKLSPPSIQLGDLLSWYVQLIDLDQVIYK